MSGRIAKSQIPVLPRAGLPPDASAALIRAKNELKAPKDSKIQRALKAFRNERGNSDLEGPPLPDPAQGCTYFEQQVGHAHPGDPRQAGSKRLVLEVNTSSMEIKEFYYTAGHYGKSTFVRVV